MPNVSNTYMSWFFLNSIPLSCKINLEQEVLGRISLINAIETLSAILLFIGTIIRYGPNKHINVRVCLLPSDVAVVDQCNLWCIQQKVPFEFQNSLVACITN